MSINIYRKLYEELIDWNDSIDDIYVWKLLTVFQEIVENIPKLICENHGMIKSKHSLALSQEPIKIYIDSLIDQLNKLILLNFDDISNDELVKIIENYFETDYKDIESYIFPEHHNFERFVRNNDIINLMINKIINQPYEIRSCSVMYNIINDVMRIIFEDIKAYIPVNKKYTFDDFEYIINMYKNIDEDLFYNLVMERYNELPEIIKNSYDINIYVEKFEELLKKYIDDMEICFSNTKNEIEKYLESHNNNLRHRCIGIIEKNMKYLKYHKKIMESFSSFCKNMRGGDFKIVWDISNDKKHNRFENVIVDLDNKTFTFNNNVISFSRVILFIELLFKGYDKYSDLYYKEYKVIQYTKNLDNMRDIYESIDFVELIDIADYHIVLNGDQISEGWKIRNEYLTDNGYLYKHDKSNNLHHEYYEDGVYIYYTMYKFSTENYDYIINLIEKKYC